MSRHRGAKPRRRCELLDAISLLSPEYLLSDERWPSTRDHRITKPYFRTCSTCQSRSQAPFCLYTRRLISDQPEGTFGRLRYTFGRRPPQSNYPPGTVPDPDHGPRLERQKSKGGISTATPRELAPPSQSLPPILHIRFQYSLPSYSKGSQGLSV